MGGEVLLTGIKGTSRFISHLNSVFSSVKWESFHLPPKVVEIAAAQNVCESDFMNCHALPAVSSGVRLAGEEERGQRRQVLCSHLYSEPRVQAHNGRSLSLC